MIIGSDQPTALTILEQSNYIFYLGGSRRMAQRYDKLMYDISFMPDAAQQRHKPRYAIQVTEDTDYDLYATYDKGIEAFLVSKGFEPSPANEYYLDSECIAIYVKDKVQVVLRGDAEFYRTVFENIDLEVYYHYLWKSSPEQPNRYLIGPFFNMLFDIAHATEGV